MKNLQKQWTTIVVSVGVAVIIATLTSLADVPEPVLKITNLGSNQVLVTITNGASTNYTLFWTPLLNDPNYPWLAVTNLADTNFLINIGEWPTGWFQVLVGSDQDGDGWPEWMDAQPGNPSVGILSLTIDSPLNGANLD
jgi:hypothetical protein